MQSIDPERRVPAAAMALMFIAALAMVAGVRTSDVPNELEWPFVAPLAEELIERGSTARVVTIGPGLRARSSFVAEDGPRSLVVLAPLRGDPDPDLTQALRDRFGGSGVFRDGARVRMLASDEHAFLLERGGPDRCWVSEDGMLIALLGNGPSSFAGESPAPEEAHELALMTFHPSRQAFGGWVLLASGPERSRWSVPIRRGLADAFLQVQVGDTVRRLDLGLDPPQARQGDREREIPRRIRHRLEAAAVLWALLMVIGAGWVGWLTWLADARPRSWVVAALVSLGVATAAAGVRLVA